MTNTSEYEVGDIIEYSPYGGGLRRVKVTAKVEDIKNGEDGFEGVLVDGELEVWGMNSQILIPSS